MRKLSQRSLALSFLFILISISLFAIPTFASSGTQASEAARALQEEWSEKFQKYFPEIDEKNLEERVEAMKDIQFSFESEKKDLSNFEFAKKYAESTMYEIVGVVAHLKDITDRLEKEPNERQCKVSPKLQAVVEKMDAKVLADKEKFHAIEKELETAAGEDVYKVGGAEVYLKERMKAIEEVKKKCEKTKPRSSTGDGKNHTIKAKPGNSTESGSNRTRNGTGGGGTSAGGTASSSSYIPSLLFSLVFLPVGILLL
ncbi:hypothetical protein BJ508DRAFT_341008 [Ascobolus immersus RN42]|uniref:Uncharacterized protein n=1 Tax=Ascobolus immersus RN42 TaxID=1160509 RepID=A0A3N4IER3_ASCIM|nr:hypothetical protein BJ508DRAFT_341008 [Ascobolus immersus RN42]